MCICRKTTSPARSFSCSHCELPAQWTARSPGKVGEPEGVSREPSGKDRNRGCSLAPSPAFCCFHFWVPLISSWIKHPCLGALRDVPSPSHGVHVSIPTALADAKSFLTVPDCPVTSVNSRVWQPTISSQTAELTAAPNPCQEFAHPLEQAAPHPHYKGLSALQTKPPCLQHCSHFALFSPVKDAERSWRLCEAGGAVPQHGWSPLQALPSHSSAQQDFKHCEGVQCYHNSTVIHFYLFTPDY